MSRWVVFLEIFSAKIFQMILSCSDFYQDNFFKQNLADETIEQKRFEDCQFNNCTFVNCKFKKCHFSNCVFKDCVLSAVILTDSTWVDVKFQNSKVIGIDWTRAKQVQEISFEDCQLNYSNFRFLSLPKLQLIHCEAKEVDFSGVNLANSVFHDSDLDRSIFFKTNLTGVDFRAARNYFIDARVNKVTKAQFSLPEALSLLSGLDVVIE